jgi:hypothetical protein
MRETRQSGSEGGEAKCLPYPYHVFSEISTASRGWRVCTRHDAERPGLNTKWSGYCCASL